MFFLNKPALVGCAFCYSLSFAVQIQTAQSSTDVLGRHNSKVRRSPTIYVTQTPDAQVSTRALMKSSYFNDEISIPTNKGRFEVSSTNASSKKYWLNDISYSESAYVSKANDIEANDPVRRSYNSGINKNNNFNSFYRSITADTGVNPCAGQNQCDVPGTSITRYTAVNYQLIFNNSKFTATPSGKDIGIYMSESASPNTLFSDFSRLATCATESNEMASVSHYTNTVRVINATAPNASIYTIDAFCEKKTSSELFPNRPDTYTPKIYIGSHSYGPNSAEKDNLYSLQSAAIDNYVYNNRVIEFTSAGNAANSVVGYKDEVTALSRGVNVIAVGAVEPKLLGGKYDKTSSKANPTYYNHNSTADSHRHTIDKPEIANFSNFFFPNDPLRRFTYSATTKDIQKDYYPSISKTSGATPYTAALAANLLSTHPFYKWHPEVVKALMLTSSTVEIKDKDRDTDNLNKFIGKGTPSYAAMTKGNRSRYWNGNNTDFYKNNLIEFNESNIKVNKKYRIAIAWLSDGTFVYNYGLLPQANKLSIWQNGKEVAVSNNTYNSFQIVEFTAASTGDLTIKINRTANRGGRVLLGYNMYEVP